MSAPLNDTDIDHLRGLRSARVRKASAPAVPLDCASRLGEHGFAWFDPSGGLNITDAGMRFLEAKFLFCAAAGCDGFLFAGRNYPTLLPHYRVSGQV